MNDPVFIQVEKDMLPFMAEALMAYLKMFVDGEKLAYAFNMKTTEENYAKIIPMIADTIEQINSRHFTLTTDPKIEE